MKFLIIAAAFLRHDFHTFRCPCYVLDSRLQIDPKEVPKWEPQGRLGIYLGCSPSHAGKDTLVFNPKMSVELKPDKLGVECGVHVEVQN